MKKYLYVLCVVIWFFSSCSEDKSVNPGNTTPTTPVVTESVGTAGGTLETENFTLEIPAGTFTTTRDVKLYVMDDGQAFKENSNTPYFKIEGLPVHNQQPLHIKLKYEGELSKESWIAVGQKAFITTLGEYRTAEYLHQATDSSGYLTCIIPASSPDETMLMKNSESFGVEPDLPIFVNGVTGEVTTSTNHFDIINPGGNVSVSGMAKAGDYLEEAYSAYLNEYNFRYDARKKWPVQVRVKDLSDYELETGGTPWGLFCGSIKGVDFSSIEIHDELVSNSSLDGDLRGVVSHEFFHLVQSLYPPTGPVADSLYRWLDEATATYCGEEFVPNFHYKTTKLTMNPFTGMQPDNSLRTLFQGQHGYGMNSMIRYLVEKGYFKHMLEYTYTNVHEKGMHPVEALIDATEEPEAWLEDFFRQFILGNIYPVEFMYIMGNEDEFEILEGKDKTFQLTHSYKDLSANLHTIWLSNPNISPSSSLKLSISGGDPTGTEITVFECDLATSKRKKIAYGIDQVLVRGLKEMTDRKATLLVLVTKAQRNAPYTNKTDITLHGEIIEESTSYQITSCNMSLTDFAVYHMRDWENPEKTDVEMRHLFSYWSQTAVGTCTDNVFEGTWDVTDQYKDSKGTIRATLIGSPPNIYELVVTDTTWHKDFDGNLAQTESFTIKLHNLEDGGEFYGGISWYIPEDSVCDHVLDIEHTYHYHDYQGEKFTDTATRWECRWDNSERLSVDLRGTWE